MGKVIKNPIEVRVVKEDGVTICSAHYGLSSEEYPDISIRKGISITLKAETLDDIDKETMEQINTHEGI